MEPLNEEQAKTVSEFKRVRSEKKAGRPPKEFGLLLKLAATVLKEAGKLSNGDIAAELNVSPATVAKILKDSDLKLDVEDLDKTRELFAQKTAQIVFKLLNATDDVYIQRLAAAKNTGLVQAITAAVNVMNQLSGKPTSIVEVRDAAADVAMKLKEVEELEAALQQSMIKGDSPEAN